MEVKEFNDPWPHIEVRNFLPKKLYQEIRNWSNDVAIGEGNTTRLVLKTRGTDGANYRWLGESIKYFKKLLINQDINVDDFDIIVEYRTIGHGFKFPLHKDIPEKYFSFILGTSDEGEGTKLYSGDNENDLAKAVDWIPNGGVAFKRSDISWHNYENNTCEKRDTLILFY